MLIYSKWYRTASSYVSRLPWALPLVLWLVTQLIYPVRSNMFSKEDGHDFSDMLLFFKKGQSHVYFSQEDTPKFYDFPVPSIIHTMDIFDLNTCVNAVESSNLASLVDSLSIVVSHTNNNAQQIVIDECFLLAFKWTIGLDTTTDLATEETTQEFSIFFVKDLTGYRELQEEVEFISKQIVYFKLYVEVFLNQILFILISKFGRKLVKEFTKPLDELGEVLKDFTDPNTRESVLLGKINAIETKYLELLDLKNEITDFGYLCIVNQMIIANDLKPQILEKALSIFNEKQNPDGIYMMYSHLVNYYLEKKSFNEAIHNLEALEKHLSELKTAMTSGVHYNNDELTVVNLKLFYNYYRLINIRKKFLITSENNKRSYWKDVMENFRKLFSLLNEIEIKETIVLKLMIKKANIHFYLDKINHAEEALTEAMNRYQEYVKHGKTPIHWSPDQKILCYLQQKLYLSYAEIKLKKGLHREAYDFFMKCLEYGPIYSPNLRSKCYDGLTRLLKSLDDTIFSSEIEYTRKLSHLYREDKKEYLFLLDSTKELNQNLGSIHRLIKDIFEMKMRPRDAFAIYCFSSELKKIQDSITKRSIKGSALGIFNQNYDLLKLKRIRESANETYRHSWDAMLESLDILFSNNEDIKAKYLVVFVFGDVVPLLSVRKGRSDKKKITQILREGVHDWQKRNSVYDRLIEKIEDSFVNVAIFGYNLDQNTRQMYQRIIEVSKNGLYINIDNEHPYDGTQEFIDFF